jgi:hypothetical protein
MLTITVEEAGEIPEEAVYDLDSVAAEFDDDAEVRSASLNLVLLVPSYASGELTISELSNMGRVFASG